MADRYWVLGTGTWDATSTTNWSTSSGGAGGASVPTASDNVFFDANSNVGTSAFTVTMATSSRVCNDFTASGLDGTMTLAGSSIGLTVSGSLTFQATNFTRTYTGTTTFNATTTGKTVTTNGVAFGGAVTFDGVGGGWTLGSAINTGASSITVTNGTFDTSSSGNYAVTGLGISSNNSNTRTINLNSSTITCSAVGTALSFGTITNLTFNAGTSQINLSGSSSTISSGGLTFYNVSFTSAVSTTLSITGANTFNNLTFPGRTNIGIGTVTFAANQTINGTLTLNAGTTAAYRTFLRSDIIGTSRTLTVNALAAGAADYDFRDITVTGSAAPLTGTRFGDAKGNSGITFPAAKTVYYRQTGSANWGATGSGSWSATSGGALNATQFPLAQDTAVFPAATYPASGSTTTINSSYNIGTIDMSLRTSNTMTLATGTNQPTIYGNWINGTGITLAGTGVMTFTGRGSQTITSAGKTFTQAITINSPSGSVTLQDNYVTSSAAVNTLTAGTFDVNGFNITIPYFASSGTSTRTLAIGSGTWTTDGNNGINTAFDCSTSTNLTITGTGTINLTSGFASKTFAGGGASYSGITLNQGGAGDLRISGSNTFGDITNTVQPATILFTAGTTNTFSNFSLSGTAGNLITIDSITPSSHTLSKASGTVSRDFLSISRSTATGGALWYAGANSTNGGNNTGWIFTAPPVVVYDVYISESATALDSISATFGATTYLSNIAESNQAFDTFSALASFRSAASETARATDSVASNATLGSAVSETVNAADTASSNATMGSAVSDSVTVTDSAAAKQTFQTNISDTVNAADTTSSLQGLSGSISEQATAQDTAAAAQSFASSVSDTAKAADSVASRATMGSAVSDSATVADSAAAKQVFQTNISNTVNAADAVAGDKSLRGFIVEQVSPQDTVAATQAFRTAIIESSQSADIVSAIEVFRSTISETARASETNTAKALFGAAVSNTVNVSESPSAKALFGGAVSETARALDSVQSNAVFRSQVADSVQVSDAPNAAATFKSQFSATVQVQDTAASSQGFGSSVAESATAQDTTSSLRSLPGRISESATAQESVAVRAIFRGIIDEVVRGSDQFSASVVFLAAFSEFARANAESVGYLTGSRSISESSTASDAASATKTLPGSISESVTGVDQSAASLIWAAYANEQAAGLDSLNAPNSTYSARVANTVRALDTPSTNAIFYAAVIAYAGITDIATARYLWELIDDSQTANWVDVSSVQSAAWSLIDDSQGGTWALIPTPLQTTNTSEENYWRGSATDGSVTLVLGLNGYMARSTDAGQTWSTYTLPYSIQFVVWSNGAFYISDEDTYFASSTNGLDWTQLTNPTSSLFPTSIPAVTVICGSSIGLFVVAQGLPYMSYDGGFTWTEGTLTTLLNAASAIWDGSKFVLSGRNIYTSTNGLNWTTRLNPGSQFQRVFRTAWNGSLFVATYWDPVGAVTYRSYTSPNGITWTNVTSTYGRAFVTVSYANGRFVLVAASGAQSAYYTSVTGTTTPVLQGTILGYRSQYNAGNFQISYVGATYVLPGYQNDLANLFFYTSTNLTTFSPATYFAVWGSIDDSAPTTWQNVNTLS